MIILASDFDDTIYYLEDPVKNQKNIEDRNNDKHRKKNTFGFSV